MNYRELWRAYRVYSLNFEDFPPESPNLIISRFVRNATSALIDKTNTAIKYIKPLPTKLHCSIIIANLIESEKVIV